MGAWWDRKLAEKPLHGVMTYVIKGPPDSNMEESHALAQVRYLCKEAGCAGSCLGGDR